MRGPDAKTGEGRCSTLFATPNASCAVMPLQSSFAHKRFQVQGNVDPSADCSVSLIGLEGYDLVFSIDDGETSFTAVIPRGGYSRAGDENLRERVPDGQRRRELPLERRVGADVVSRLNTPSRFRKSRSFKVSKPRRQYAQGRVGE